MITSKQALAHYGQPENESSLVLWRVPKELQHGAVPQRIYCNRDLVIPLTHAFTNLIDRGFIDELKTWDGCFNIRKKKLGASMSLHSWALAIDMNAAWNQIRRAPTLSAGFVKCFTDAGFIWGGTWRTPDGMHFELAEIPK